MPAKKFGDFGTLLFCAALVGRLLLLKKHSMLWGIPYVGGESPDTPKDAVSIMTIHKSKGLEFPNVFVAGVCTGLLPHYLTNKKEWDEELRLLYVAMTRAKNWLCLSSYDRDESQYQCGRSQFLGYIPCSLLESIDTLHHTPIPSRLEERGGSTTYQRTFKIC